MAITTLPPLQTKPVTLPGKNPPKVVNRGAKVFLRILPDLKVEEGSRTSSRGFILILAAIVLFNVLALLAINTFMAQDAFLLERLKVATNATNDQRDAYLRMSEQKASPDYLAASATKLGMIPATTIKYLDLNAAPASAPAVGTLVVNPGK
jgi:hypothetical protein